MPKTMEKFEEALMSDPGPAPALTGIVPRFGFVNEEGLVLSRGQLRDLTVVANSSVPSGEVHFVDDKGRVVAKIVQLEGGDQDKALPLRERIDARLADYDTDDDGGQAWLRLCFNARERGHRGDCPHCAPSLTGPITCLQCVVEDALKEADAWIAEAQQQNGQTE